MDKKIKASVRTQLGTMGPDEFERLISELLPHISPGFDKVEPSFNHIGKTTKGKCDAHVYHAQNDSYTAILCTTKQNYNRTKILDDINKLTSTRFFPKIKSVLLCVNTPIRDEVEDYRSACKNHNWSFDPFSLERITDQILGNSNLLFNYFNEQIYPETPNNFVTRRFDCGARLKIARSDISLLESRFIEEINFPSEREWKSIEKEEIEVSENYIEATCNFTGISKNWIKHGTPPKYPVITIYDYDSKKIDAIAEQGALNTYIIIEPEHMTLALAVQYSEYRWQIFLFGFCLDFWNWQGDENHIPIIFELLSNIDKKLKHPYGRIVSKKIMEDIQNGERHLSTLFKSTGFNSYWFDDLFDLYHRYFIAQNKYQHHGDWFVKLQAEFRYHISEESLTSIKVSNL